MKNRFCSLNALNDLCTYQSRIYPVCLEMFCCSFHLCGATYVSMFVSSKHKQGCKYQHCHVKQTAVVLSASASVQENHSLSSKGAARSFPASGVVQETDFIGACMDHSYTSCSTTFQNNNFCTAAELIFGVKQECSKRFTEKLLNLFCRIRLTSAEFKDQLHSLEAC